MKKIETKKESIGRNRDTVSSQKKIQEIGGESGKIKRVRYWGSPHEHYKDSRTLLIKILRKIRDNTAKVYLQTS